MKNNAVISFSAFEPTDIDWIFHLHKLSLREYVENIWGWDEAWQRENFPKSLEDGTTSIILINGERAGRLTISTRDDHVFLNYVALLPRFRNQGYGTRIINLVHGHFPRMDIRLTVLRGNPVIDLYSRIGFTIESRAEIRTYMRRKPSQMFLTNRSSHALTLAGHNDDTLLNRIRHRNI